MRTFLRRLPKFSGATGMMPNTVVDEGLAGSADSAGSMSKADRGDELRPEYDFSKMSGGVRGRYVDRYREGTNLALLEPDVAEAFPTDDQVNAALRSYLRGAQRGYGDGRATEQSEFL